MGDVVWEIKEAKGEKMLQGADGVGQGIGGSVERLAGGISRRRLCVAGGSW